MRALRTIKREQFDDIIKNLNLKEITCGNCGRKITKKNFGILAKGFYSCDNKLCLQVVVTEMQFYDKQRGK